MSLLKPSDKTNPYRFIHDTPILKNTHNLFTKYLNRLAVVTAGAWGRV